MKFNGIEFISAVRPVDCGVDDFDWNAGSDGDCVLQTIDSHQEPIHLFRAIFRVTNRADKGRCAERKIAGDEEIFLSRRK